MDTSGSTQSKSRLSDTALVVLLTTLLSFCFLGARPFSTRGEPREALVAQAMVESGNYLLGTGYGGVVPSKPPFMHWFIAAFSTVPGEVTEWTARAPSALASFSFLLGWFFFLRRRIGVDRAVFATLLLLTSVEWFRAASTTRVDMTLAALLGFAFMGLYRWWEQKLSGVPLWTIVALWGATLTKGPVAIMLPGAIFGLFLLLQGERLSRIIGKCLIVFVPALCGALLWYVAAYLERGPEFFQKFYYENFARLTSTQEDSPHKHSALYLLATIPLGLMPWTIVTLPLVWNGVVGLRRREAIRGLPAQIRKAFMNGSALGQFCTIAALVFVVFFSIPSGKRSVYLLPVYPFFALGLSEILLRLRYHELRSVRIMLRTVAAIIVFAAITGAVALSALGSGNSALQQRIQGSDLADLQKIVTQMGVVGVSVHTLMLALLMGLLVYGAIYANRILQHPRHMGIFFALLFLAANGSVIVLLSEQSTAKSFAPDVSRQAPSEAPLYSYGNEFYGLSFYLKREIRSLRKGMAPELGSYVVLYARNVSELEAALAPGAQLVKIGESPNSVDKPGRPLVLYNVRAVADAQ
ncbi:MAG: hypothetical protein EBZ48_02275 [Proteobacteria bacterium]|nr:hypothetical protein [Pseudomonadota bacterium]